VFVDLYLFVNFWLGVLSLLVVRLIVVACLVNAGCWFDFRWACDVRLWFVGLLCVRSDLDCRLTLFDYYIFVGCSLDFVVSSSSVRCSLDICWMFFLRRLFVGLCFYVRWVLHDRLTFVGGSFLTGASMDCGCTFCETQMFV